MCFYKNKAQYLRIILTNRCNLSCYYCHREGLENERFELSCSEIVEYAKIFYEIGVRKIKLMGGEPTLRNDVDAIIKGIRNYAIDADISLITNGILIKNVAKKYIDAGLDRINVSVHGWDPKKYCLTTQSLVENLEATKNSILWLKKNNMLTKINFVIQKGVNEKDVISLIHWCIKHDITLDLLNMLYNSKNKDELENLYYSFFEIKKLIEDFFEIKAVELFNNNYSLQSTRIILKSGGRINLKTSTLNNELVFNSCRDCKEFEFCREGIKAIRLTNRGIIKPCIFRDDNVLDLKKIYYDCNNYNETVNTVRNYITGL